MTRQCPNLGRYEIVSLFRSPNADNIEDILAADSEQSVANAAEVHDVRVPSTPLPRQCHHGSVRRLDIGCRTPDRMEFATSCSDEALSGKDCSVCYFGAAALDCLADFLRQRIAPWNVPVIPVTVIGYAVTRYIRDRTENRILLLWSIVFLYRFVISGRAT
jgi:hypothetical protein